MSDHPGIVGILLAAGTGSRFDPSGASSKLLQPTPRGPCAGQPLALAALRSLRPVDEVVAVVAPPTTEPQRELHALMAAAGCRLVVNPLAAQGMGTSIACGVTAAAEADGWIIALADMPCIAPATIAAVAHALRAGATTVAPTLDGRRGHPVGFAAALYPALAALDGDRGASAILAAHPPQLIAVDDPGCLLDLDYATDFVPPPA